MTPNLWQVSAIHGGKSKTLSFATFTNDWKWYLEGLESEGARPEAVISTSFYKLPVVIPQIPVFWQLLYVNQQFPRIVGRSYFVEASCPVKSIGKWQISSRIPGLDHDLVASPNGPTPGWRHCWTFRASFATAWQSGLLGSCHGEISHVISLGRPSGLVVSAWCCPANFKNIACKCQARHSGHEQVGS